MDLPPFSLGSIRLLRVPWWVLGRKFEATHVLDIHCSYERGHSRSERLRAFPKTHRIFSISSRTGHLSSFKNLYDAKCANCNLTFFRESQNAGRERFAISPRESPPRRSQKNSVAKAFAKVEFLVHVMYCLCRRPCFWYMVNIAMLETVALPCL